MHIVKCRITRHIFFMKVHTFSIVPTWRWKRTQIRNKQEKKNFALPVSVDAIKNMIEAAWVWVIPSDQHAQAKLCVVTVLSLILSNTLDPGNEVISTCITVTLQQRWDTSRTGTNFSTGCLNSNFCKIQIDWKFDNYDNHFLFTFIIRHPLVQIFTQPELSRLK
jgi:hypothetical protein